MGSRKVRKSEAQRRGERAPASEKTRRTLRDLPNYNQQQDERATNPVIQLTQRTTALPPPLPVEDSVTEHSLEALALLARRSAPPPRASFAPRLVPPVAPVVPIAPVSASAPTVLPVAPAAVKPSSIPAMTVGTSSAPPAHPTSSPPRRRASDHAPRRGPLGTVVLSATVGAIVALAAWTVRSGLDRVARENDTTRPTGTLAAAALTTADNCPAPSAAPASSPAPATATTAQASTVLAASTAEQTPRVSFDALPVARSGEPAPVARTISRRSTTPASPRPAFVAARAESEPESRPAPKRAPAAPVSPRAAVTNAVQRASFAARSCESGPQSGKVEVTFSPTGAVSSVNLIRGFDDAGVNGCVLRAFGRVRVAAFEGEPITVRKTVSW